jgi:hypothetical protein
MRVFCAPIYTSLSTSITPIEPRMHAIGSTAQIGVKDTCGGQENTIRSMRLLVRAHGRTSLLCDMLLNTHEFQEPRSRDPKRHAESGKDSEERTARTHDPAGCTGRFPPGSCSP